MKILPILTFLIVISCKTPKEGSLSHIEPFVPTECPEDGSCKFDILLNKQLELKKDEFNSFYPVITDNESQLLLVFEYKKNEIENTADGGYKEIIYVQLNKENLDLNLVDLELEKVKLTFARLCFCRDNNGYFPINKGTLTLKKLNKKEYLLTIQLNTNGIPNVINTVSEIFALKE